MYVRGHNVKLLNHGETKKLIATKQITGSGHKWEAFTKRQTLTPTPQIAIPTQRDLRSNKLKKTDVYNQRHHRQDCRGDTPKTSKIKTEMGKATKKRQFRHPGSWGNALWREHAVHTQRHGTVGQVRLSDRDVLDSHSVVVQADFTGDPWQIVGVRRQRCIQRCSMRMHSHMTQHTQGAFIKRATSPVGMKDGPQSHPKSAGGFRMKLRCDGSLQTWK